MRNAEAAAGNARRPIDELSPFIGKVELSGVFVNEFFGDTSCRYTTMSPHFEAAPFFGAA